MASVVSVLTAEGSAPQEEQQRRGKAPVGKTLTGVSDETVTCHCTQQTLQTQLPQEQNRGSEPAPA